MPARVVSQGRGVVGPAGPTGATGPAGPSTVSDSVFRVQDNADATKQLALEVSGITTATTRTLTVQDVTGTVALTADVTTHAALTAAHGATGAVVGTTNTQTLTNKSVDAAQLTGTVPVARFNAGTGASTTTWLRGDGTWVAPGSGSGDVVGPAASVDSEVALYSGVTGKLIKRATGTGIVKLTAGVQSVLADPLPVANGGTAATTAAAARTSLGAQSKIVNNVMDSGAIGDGVADDTAAIVTALALGGITFFPAGTYLHTGLTLAAGAHLMGVGAGFYTTASVTTARSILKMKNTTNANSITIPTGLSYGIIEDLEINGNKANNPTAGNGIIFAVAAAAEECGWELRHVEVYNATLTGIYVGANRQAVYADHVLVTGSGNHGVQINATDSTWVKLMAGTSAWKNIVVNGSVTRLIGGESWSAGESGVVVISPMVSISDMGIDRNQQHGIWLDTGANHVTISGCHFHSNSQAATNTYSDVNVGVSGNFSVVGNVFGPLDGGITLKRKYAIATTGNAVLHTSNTHDATATQTAYTDSTSNLDAWASKAVPAGVVIGTTDTQTFTNKSIDSAQLTGTVPVARFNSGTAASTTTWLRGDGTWVAPGGTGDVTGPAASVDSEVALFSLTTGKVLKRATGTGIAKLTAGVLSVLTDPLPIANGGTASATAGAALTALGAQPLDSDLTTIAGLTATTDSFMQSKASAWSSRTVAQVKTDLGIIWAKSMVTIPAAIANTTTETAFGQTHTIAANTLVAGDVVRLFFACTYSSTGVPTLVYRLKNGANILLAGPIISTGGNALVPLNYPLELTFRTIGASGALEVNGFTHAYDGGIAGVQNSVTIDTTAAIVFGVTAAWSAASTLNTTTLRQYTGNLTRPF